MNLLLRDVIRRLLQERKLTQLELVERLKGKVKQANLSAVLNGKRQFTLTMLDSITEALELEKGSLYLYYEQECFDKRGNLRPQKAKEFILSCYEMGLGHFTKRLVNRLVEHGSDNGKILFSIAERLFELGLLIETLFYYNTVIDMETGTRAESDRTAISCYRRFVVHERLQTESVHDVFVMLTGCLKNMPKKSERRLPGDSDNLQFDAYRRAIAYCMEREMWHRVMTLSEQFGKLAITERDSLALGHSLLYKAEAVLSLHHHHLAVQLLDECALIPSPQLETDVHTFRLRLALIQGDMSRLEECLAWLSRHPDQLPELLPVMLKACLTQNLLAEAARVLEDCAEGMAERQADQSGFSQKKWNLRMNRLLAEYLIRTGGVEEGGERLLSAVREAIFLQLVTDVVDCMLLYEEVRELIPREKQVAFTELLRSAKP